MKMLKKLALVSAVSMISAGAFAMEAMDDEAMAATTGQDGITINIIPDRISYGSAAAMGVTDKTMAQIANIGGYPAAGYKGLSISEIRVHDDDGVGAAGSATANSGALVIGGGLGAVTELQDRTVVLAKGDKPIQLNIDMVGDSDGTGGSSGGAMLNVVAKLPTTAIKLGNIYVANSNAAEAGRDADGTVNAVLAEVDGSSVSNKVKILDGLEIVLGESELKIQLGNEDAGNHMITADSKLIGGLTLNKFALYDESGAAALTADNLITGDVGSGGNIRASSITILDNTATGVSGTDLTSKAGIDVGSRITTNSTVSSTVRDANYNTVFTALNTGAAAAVFTGASLSASSTDGDVTTALATATTNAATAAGALVTANTNLATANANLASARDTEANILVPGSTYAQLSPAQQGTVNGTGSVTTAQTAQTTASTNQATAFTTDANAKGAVKAITLLATGTQGRVGMANTAAATTGNWSGVDTYNGLVISAQLGDATYGANVSINNLALGDANAAVMGDVQIIGLRMGTSKIVIMGH